MGRSVLVATARCAAEPPVPELLAETQAVASTASELAARVSAVPAYFPDEERAAASVPASAPTLQPRGHTPQDIDALKSL